MGKMRSKAKMLGRDIGGMDALLLAKTGCGGFCPTHRVKGCKIGPQFVFQLYHLILYHCYVLELGFTTLANKDRRTTRFCLICFMYFIKPHSKHHLYFSSKNSPLNISPSSYNLFPLFLLGKKTNCICTNSSKSPLILRDPRVVLIAR